MSKIIVTAVFTALGALALRAVIRHLRGESGCCDDNELLPPRKKLKGVKIGTKIVHLRGMHCAQCQRRVEVLLEAIDGAAAEADLAQQQAVVSMSRVVADEEIRSALQGSGYVVTEIEGVTA